MARACAVRRDPGFRGRAGSPPRPHRAARPRRSNRDPRWTRSARPAPAARHQRPERADEHRRSGWGPLRAPHRCRRVRGGRRGATPEAGPAPRATRGAFDSRGLPADGRHRRSRARSLARADRRFTRRASRRGQPWHFGVLSNEDAHHDRARHAARIQPRCRRRGLARCSPYRPPCSRSGVSRSRRTTVHSIPDLDVAEPRGSRAGRMAEVTQRADRRPSASGGISRPRSLQLVQVTRRGSPLLE